MFPSSLLQVCLLFIRDLLILFLSVKSSGANQCSCHRLRYCYFGCQLTRETHGRGGPEIVHNCCDRRVFQETALFNNRYTKNYYFLKGFQLLIFHKHEQILICESDDYRIKPFPCGQCDKSFTWKSGFKRNINGVHKGVNATKVALDKSLDRVLVFAPAPNHLNSK